MIDDLKVRTRLRVSVCMCGLFLPFLLPTIPTKSTKPYTQLLSASVRSLTELISTTGDVEGESKEPEHEDEQEYEGEEDGEQPVVRPLGGFERFFGAFGQLGRYGL